MIDWIITKLEQREGNRLAELRRELDDIRREINREDFRLREYKRQISKRKVQYYDVIIGERTWEDNQRLRKEIAWRDKVLAEQYIQIEAMKGALLGDNNGNQGNSSS